MAPAEAGTHPTIAWSRDGLPRAPGRPAGRGEAGRGEGGVLEDVQRRIGGLFAARDAAQARRVEALPAARSRDAAEARDARAELVTLLPRLRRFALSLAGNPHDADDIVQSAIERALSFLERETPPERLDSWMYKIVQNGWIDLSRRKKTRGETVDMEVLENTQGEDGRAQADRRMMAAEIRRCFAALAPDFRAAAALVIINGASYKDAAEALGVPIGTVMSRVARARQQLARALA